MLKDAILFDFASDYLNESAHPHLDKIVTLLNSKPDLELIIMGHTDNVGPAQYNQSLSKRRAQSVMAYFTRQGINKSRFTVKGIGAEQPVASNDNDAGRSKNRRVEFEIKE
ncbi:MAG: OmpA family protein [Cyclobacteriaceae bacterium]|nr:OmpA family protein [Cyclobacteriaceae bacterium]